MTSKITVTDEMLEAALDEEERQIGDRTSLVAMRSIIAAALRAAPAPDEREAVVTRGEKVARARADRIEKERDHFQEVANTFRAKFTEADARAEKAEARVRELEARTARELMDAAWEAAHVPEDGIIPAGAEYMTKFPGGKFGTGSAWETDIEANTNNTRRLLDPPAPKRPEGAEEIERVLAEEVGVIGSNAAREIADSLAARGVRVVPEDGAS